jgi:hypothetical protein
MRLVATLVALSAVAAHATAAEPGPPDATALPLATQRLVASADECAVWRRERSFSRSVETHDAAVFASHLHPGTIFNAGTAQAERGRDAVARSWSGLIEGKTAVLRWRPGIVSIGGDPDVAVSRGPYILRTTADGVDTFSVGFYLTVWVRDPGDQIWRVLFDGAASALTKLADRAAAETWVAAQPMSDCAGASP